jgi:hypothetical protein
VNLDPWKICELKVKIPLPLLLLLSHPLLFFSVGHDIARNIVINIIITEGHTKYGALTIQCKHDLASELILEKGVLDIPQAARMKAAI